MSARGFTRGPWLVDPHRSTRIVAPNPYGFGEMHIADVRGWGHLCGAGGCAFHESEAALIQDATARLIAAPPEMYELLAEMPTPSQGIPPLEWYRRRAALLARIDSEKAPASVLP